MRYNIYIANGTARPIKVGLNKVISRSYPAYIPLVTRSYIAAANKWNDRVLPA